MIALAYSREHVCHNKPMIWQPAAHSFYCPVRKCHRREAPNEYGTPSVEQPRDDSEITVDQPEPA
jgi:hypothetical protein